MRRLLLVLCLVALFAAGVTASVGAKVKPPVEGLTATPTNVVWDLLPLDGYYIKWVTVTNETSHVVSFQTPRLTSPFSLFEARNCDALAPGSSECMIGYRADGNAAGTFTQKVTQPFFWHSRDGTEETINLKLTLSVTVAANHAPTTANQSVSTTAGTPLTITLTGSDPDGDPLSFAIWMKNVAYGSLTSFSTPVCTPTGTVPSVCTSQTTYTPTDDEFTGTDDFGFKVSDGQFYKAASVTITVTEGGPVNHAPTANNYEWQYWDALEHEFEISGADPDGNALTFSIVDYPDWGTLGTADIADVSCSGAVPNVCTTTVSFTAPVYEEPFKSTSFTFVTSDGDLQSDRATVSVIVS